MSETLKILIEVFGPIMYVFIGLTLSRWGYTRVDEDWSDEPVASFFFWGFATLLWPVWGFAWGMSSYVTGGLKKKKSRLRSHLNDLIERRGLWETQAQQAEDGNEIAHAARQMAHELDKEINRTRKELKGK